MTLAEFNALDLERRCEAIWEWGFYISRNMADQQNKVLYSLNGFFAEMIFSENNRVVDVVAFDNVRDLNKPGYLITSDNPFIRAVA